jgi:hypothetical protein
MMTVADRGNVDVQLNWEMTTYLEPNAILAAAAAKYVILNTDPAD